MRLMHAANLDRWIDLYANAAEEELEKFNTAAALRQRQDIGWSLFTEGFWPMVAGNIRNVRKLEPKNQSYFMQMYVKLILLDYILLYQYQDRLLSQVQRTKGVKLEELFP